MIDFEEARRLAFQELIKTESVEIVTPADRKQLNLQKYAEAWLISTIIFGASGEALPIQLLMGILSEFPLVLPKIYLAPQDREWVGFIPHVNIEGYVCIYDEESITIDPLQPGQIAKSCLEKVKEVLEKGLNGSNHSDFADEFVAYWSEQYDAKDELSYGLLMLEDVPAERPVLIKALNIHKPYALYDTILYSDSAAIEQFRKYFQGKGHATTEWEALYLGEIADLRPPFSFKNTDLLKLIKAYFPASQKQFEKYINKSTDNRLLVFSILSAEELLLFGLRIRPLHKNRRGFRPGMFTSYQSLSTIQINEHVRRVKFDNYTQKRLHNRTDGVQQVKRYSLVIAGLGSIGSNLLPYLTALGVERLLLIDPDRLTLENINRHLLGPGYIGTNKAAGLRNHFKDINPLVEIGIDETSIVRAFQQKAKVLNQFDYLFVAIGKNTIENFLLDALKEQMLLKPTFFLWVEPYLMGGHCLFIHPNHTIQISDLYEQNLFKYNIIAASEYLDKNKQLQLREAGCQGSYMPYGQKNITLFLSALIPHIFKCIEVGEQRNLAITWRGTNPETFSLALSDYGQRQIPGNINIISL